MAQLNFPASPSEGQEYVFNGVTWTYEDGAWQVLTGGTDSSSVHDIPINGATDTPISSNWAYDHTADSYAHHGAIQGGSGVDSATVSQIIIDDVDKPFVDALDVDAITLGGNDSDYFAKTSHTHPTDDILLLDSAITNNSAVLANTAKVTNATHSGDASGSTSLTLQPVAITGKTELASGLAGTDELLISDAGTLKRMDVSVMNAYFNANLSFNDYTHPAHPGDDFSLDTTLLSGATVVSDIDINVTTDGEGHVTDANGTVATRDLTLGDLGYTGDTNANEYSHPNHTGQVTSTGDGATVVTVSAITAQTDLPSGLAATDELLVNDNGAIKRMDISVIETYMQNNLSFGGSYTHPDHTGHVTSSNDSATVLTVAAITGQTDLPSGLASTDELLVNDGGTIKRMDISVIETYMQDNLSFGGSYTHPDHTGHVTSSNDSATVLTVAAITGQTELASGLAGTDELLVSDAGVIKRMDVSVMNAYFNSNLSFGQGTVTEVTVGTGLDVATGTTTPNITLDLSELTDMTAAVDGSLDELILLDNGAERRKLVSEITLSDFNNDAGWNNYTHPSYNGDDFSVDTTLLAGATVVSDIDINVTTDASGHVTDANGTVATRELTLADLGYTGDTNANEYVHPTSAGNKHIPSGGSSNQYLKYSASGTAVWDTLTASEVSDFDTEVSNNTSVSANTSKVTNATHTGEVSGSGALTVNVSAITGKTALTSGLSGTDELLLSDGGVIKRMDVSVMNAYFNSNLSFQASGTYNTIIGTDADISYTGATVLSTVTYTDGVATAHTSRTLTPANIGAAAVATTLSGYGITDAVFNNTPNSYSGTLTYSTAGGTALRIGGSNSDTTIWRVDGGTGSTDTAQYGFRLRYIGTGTGNNNSLDLIADNQTGTAVLGMRMLQDGTTDFPQGVTSAGSTLLTAADVDDTPVDAVTDAPVSSNWAYDHENNTTTAHGGPYTNNAGTVTNVTVGTGLDVATGTTTPSITLDLSEFTDMTAAVDGSVDELILLDNGAERRKLISEITLSDFSNDQNWNNYSHPNHTGQVTSTGDGATVLANSAITGQTALTSGLVSTDELLVSDGGTIKRMDVSVIETYMNSNLNFNNYSHPTHPGDDFSIDTTLLSGATVVSDIDINVTTDTLGHVTDANGTVATRVLTLANLGYTGETNATADQTDGEIETAYNNQVSIVSQAEAEAGTATTVRRWTAQRVKQAIAALGSGGGSTMTAVKTSNYTAVAGDRVPCNTSSSSWTLTLPASPNAGDLVEFFDYGEAFDDNNLTIGRNGQDIMNLAEDMTIDLRHYSGGLQYVDATKGWILV